MVDGKLWRENWKGNFFRVCLVKWGGRKINSEAQMFSLRTHQQVFSPKWRENWEGEAHEMSFQKYPWNSPPSLQHVGFFFFPLIFSFSITIVLAFFFLLFFSFAFVWKCWLLFFSFLFLWFFSKRVAFFSFFFFSFF